MSDDFFLGGTIEPETGDRSGAVTEYDGADLTTHGVIVGMTGSGKTGLGVIFLEEALLSGIPTLVLDPKGDMTNLLLTFPELAPQDFRPWIDEAQARRDGISGDELAASTAELWRNGLAGWDIAGDRIAELHTRTDFTIYTPGSTAGVPIDILGSLSAPTGDFDEHAEDLRTEIDGFVSGLLGLVDVDADPISSREHILLANLIEDAWRKGEDLDLAGLLTRIQHPPMRKLGVFEVDTFFPEKDRLALAMRLNGLVASPAFSAWLEGPPLDIEGMLWRDGKPQAAILYLAHLSDEERQFIVTLVLSSVITWMRSQAGTSELRALVYMDEVFGFVPPTAAPPAKKPILTLLKQARAFGVGMLLSTQNPVDLDYKAMSNAGTWAIGRLQTERDKARILEALQSARGDADTSMLDRLISGLDKRRFLLHNTREPQPELFTTRWAMSYLRGPLTRDQISQLMEAPRRTALAPREADTAAAPAATTATPPPAEEPAPAAATAPEVAAGIPVHHLDPAAPWAGDVGADTAGTVLRPAIAARVRMLYDEAPAKLKHTVEWEAVFPEPDSPFDAATGLAVDYDDRDYRAEAPPGATYHPGDTPIHSKRFFTSAGTAIKDALYRTSTLTIYRNRELKLYSRAGETEAEFAARCRRTADDRADAEVAALRERMQRTLRRLRDEVDRAADRMHDLEADVAGQRQDEVLDGIGSLLGGILGGRSSRRSASSSRAQRDRRRAAERRLGDARDRVADKIAELEDEEAEALDEIAAINEQWDEAARIVEPLEVGLEKNDIEILELALVWVPRTAAATTHSA
jgi:hypothetical protein